MSRVCEVCRKEAVLSAILAVEELGAAPATEYIRKSIGWGKGAQR